jgi:neutral ceramidase
MQRIQWNFTFGLLSAALLFRCSAEGSEVFRAGAARANLDPPTGIPMSGYGARKGVAQGVLDPVQARALVIGDGQRTIALVTLDLVFPLDAPDIEKIRAAMRPKGIDEVIVHSSHTHSGPTYSASAEGLERAITRIEEAIAAAASRMEPVRMGSGWGVTYIGFNRRYILPNGDARMFWRNEPRISSTYPVDPTIGVIRLDRMDGSPLAILVNYACHPVVLGPQNLNYSADYPSEMRNTIEQGLGGDVTAFFLQGAPGDINPYLDKTPLLEDAVGQMKRTGRKIGEAALRAARDIHTKEVANPRIQSKTVVVHVVSRWDVPKLRAMMGERYKLDPTRTARLVREQMDMPVTTLLLNGDLAFVTMPGEPFVEYQMQWRARCPLPNSYFLGYTNGSFGYFPTIAAAIRGGYGANNSATQVEVGSGERMLNTGLVSLYELMGKLSPKPAGRAAN